mgnify:CR=1 FL=1
MKKEHMQLLKKEFIKTDLYNFLKFDFIAYVLFLVISGVAGFFGIMWCVNLYSAGKMSYTDLWIYIALVLIAFGTCLAFIFWTVINLVRIKQGKFEINTDILSNINCAPNAATKINWLYERRRPERLNFEKNLTFTFKKRNVFYKWSEAYKMDGYSLLNSSAPGDKFYIVSFNGKAPIMVYNTRFFDYKAEQEQNL